eukprot:maker-scaffold_7-snap-gene-9.4-mRNA-1 protein AED:0.22 eAED:0.22 QI:382/1/1/1/1/1/2/303/494
MGDSEEFVLERENYLSPGSLSKENRGDFYEEYNVSKSLGEGSFGQVHEAVHKTTGEERAFKLIRFPSLQTQSENKRRRAIRLKEKAFEEVEFLSTLAHPNLLRLVEFFDTDEGLYIVTDIYKGKDLFYEVTSPKRKEGFQHAEVEDVLRQLLSCLAYIHDRGVVHRDIKPENIMLEKEGDLTNVKLIDFGYAVKYDHKDENAGLLAETAGTPYYVSPEVLEGAYNHTCDIWSLGVIGYILVTGRPPFNGNTNNQIFANIKAGEHRLYDYLSPESKLGKLIGKLMTHHYEDRENAEIVLAWLTESDGEFVRQPTEEERKMQRSVVENLRRFSTACRLKNLIHAYMLKKYLSKDELLKLERTFRSFDTNQNGTLSLSELESFLQSYLDTVYDQAQAVALFNELDTDNSGSIDFEEFVIGATGSRNLMNIESMGAVFDLLDADKSGDINADELRAIFRDGEEIDAEHIEELLREVSPSGASSISRAEFLKMFDFEDE